jgi:hypothetical protein
MSAAPAKLLLRRAATALLCCCHLRACPARHGSRMLHVRLVMLSLNAGGVLQCWGGMVALAGQLLVCVLLSLQVLTHTNMHNCRQLQLHSLSQTRLETKPSG